MSDEGSEEDRVEKVITEVEVPRYWEAREQEPATALAQDMSSFPPQKDLSSFLPNEYPSDEVVDSSTWGNFSRISKSKKGKKEPRAIVEDIFAD